MTTDVPSWARHLPAAVRREARKAAVLGALLVVLGGIWVRILFGGQGPAAAAAKASPAAVAAASSPAAAAADRQGAHGRALAAVGFSDWSRQHPAPLGRNLFKAPLDYYPRDPGKAAAGAADAGAVTFWDRVAKSAAAQADQRRERQVLIDNLRAKAAELRLQSTVMGSQPTAMVNGELVGEGSVVAGFRVLTIEARRIVIEREGIKLEIPMR